MSQSVGNWTANQVKLITWLAVPSQLRKPKTQGEFAEAIGVCDRTVTRWKKEPGLLDAAAELAKASVTGELPNIYGVLIDHAKRGKFNHIKLCLEIAGHYTEKKIVGGDAENPIRHEHEHREDFSNLSEDELRTHIGILGKLRDARADRRSYLPSAN